MSPESGPERLQESQPGVALRERSPTNAPALEAPAPEIAPLAQAAISAERPRAAGAPPGAPLDGVARPAERPPLRARDILALQGAAGNSAVADLIARQRTTEASHKIAAPEPPAIAPAKPPQLHEAESLPPAESETPRAPTAPARAPAVLPIPELASPEAQDVMETVESAHARSEQELGGGVDAAVSQVDTATTAQLAAVDAAVAARIAATKSAFARLKVQLTGAIGVQTAHLEATATAARTRLDAWRTTAITREKAAFVMQKQRAVASGATHAEQARTAADQAAVSSAGQIQASVARARAIGRTRANAGGKTDEIRQAKTKAALDLSGETADRVGSASGDTESQLRAQGTDIGQQLVMQAGEFAAQLEGQLPGLLGHITDIHRSSSETVGRARASARDALRKLQTQALGGLTRMENEAIGGLRAQAAARRKQLLAMKTRATTTLREQQAATQRAARKELLEFARTLATTRLRPDEALGLSQEGTATILGAFGAATAGVVTAGDKVVEQIQSSGAEAIGELDTAVTRASAHGSQFVQGGEQHAAQLGRQQATQLETAITQAIATGDASLAQMMGAIEQQVAGLDPQFGQVLTNFRSHLGDQVTTAVSKAAEPVGTLDSRIAQAQQKAEEKLSQSWLERQWHDLVSLVSSPAFWVGLLVALAVGALIILTAGAATPFIIMVAAVAAGAAGAAAGTIVSNLEHGKPVFDNVLRNMLIGGLAGGVAAAVILFGGGFIAGAELTGLAAAAVGFGFLELGAVAANTIANLLSGQPWDKNLLAAMLLAPLIARFDRALGLEPEVGAGEEEGGIPRVAVEELPPEVGDTLGLIDRGGPFPYARDGIPFGNREGLLPPEPPGYCREYTVPTPGAAGRGAQRIVTGAGGEAYYTGDHYASFHRIR